MKNFVETGERVVVAAPEDASSGEFLVVGGLFGVAEFAADSGDDVVLLRRGVFSLPKATGAAWSQGDRLYWDAGNKRFTKTATEGRPFWEVLPHLAGTLIETELRRAMERRTPVRFEAEGIIARGWADVVATPTPEPGWLCLLALGAGGLLARRRRRS